MRKRERIDSLLSLFIFLLTCALLVIYVSGCTPEPEQNQRQQWIGKWTLNDDPVLHHHFKHDGTWHSSLPGDAIIDSISDGTYSVAGDRFRVTRHDSDGSIWLGGTWERIADKLVLYVDPPPEHTSDFYQYSQKALIYTKVPETIEERKERLQRTGGLPK